MPRNPSQSCLGGRVLILEGDITAQPVDAIVNAANPMLYPGGGVSGAIHHAAGPELGRACESIRSQSHPEGVPTGEAVATPGFGLPARHVIHVVGPRWGQHGGREAELLAACYRNALRLARELGAESIAFPAISTGIYGYPPEEAARVASVAIREDLGAHEHPRQVRVVLHGESSLRTFIEHARFVD
ncbi:MAG TPA: O-acetyl-ADP-ribose deacetylase [Chromatiales bacterium]|nr:O-acetyl-ADP-ribose deacetylase [Chromatiales bacterium]